MMLPIPAILSSEAVARVRALIDAETWIDGNATSGHQSALAKRNEQLPEESSAAREAGALVLDALAASPLFVAAALPLKVYPPLFNRYAGGQAFDTHVDSAVRIRRGSDFRVRADLSVTLFLSDPDSYAGGELVVEGVAEAGVKLDAGALLLYPASHLHRVQPVRDGTRVACFFWVQSMVRDGAARRTLFELDQAIQALSATQGGDDPQIVRLTGVYHNLLRRWADV